MTFLGLPISFWVYFALAVIVALVAVGYVWLLDRAVLSKAPPKVIGRDVQVPRAVCIPTAHRKGWRS